MGERAEDELRRVLDVGDVQACKTLLASMSETARRPFAKRASARLKEVLKGDFQETAPGRYEWVSPFTDAQREAARIAVLATATLAELKRLEWDAVPRSRVEEDAAIDFLREFRPAWLDEWAEALLEFSPETWRFARRLVRESICRKPTGPNYTLGMLTQWAFRPAQPMGRQSTLVGDLLDDPGLLEDEVFRLFVTEGTSELSPGPHWHDALIELANAEMIPRARLLDASLEALERDFLQWRAGWFSRFHEGLEPTLDERAVRVDRYLRLIGSAIPPTVSFALAALERLAKAGRLPAAGLPEQLRPALLARAKGTVMTALELLEGAIKATPSVRAEAVAVAAGALSHTSADVGKAALRLIEIHGDREDPDLVALVETHAAGIAASLRGRLAGWLGKSPPAAVTVEPVAASPRRSRPSAIDPTRAIAPILTISELVDRFAFVLENTNDADEIERVLGGLSSLCGDRSPDLERLAAPLLKRASALLKKPEVEAERPVQFELARLAAGWVSRAAAARSLARGIDALGFLAKRNDILLMHVVRGESHALLSLPTHKGGVIEPAALVERVRRRGDAATPSFDAVLALLRLAREGRAPALVAAEDLPGELGEALRHALGATNTTVGPSAPLWIAAARARDPGGDDSAVEARHPGLGPGAGQAGRLVARVREETRTYSREPSITWRWVVVDKSPAMPSTVALQHCSVLLHGDGAAEGVIGHTGGVAGHDESTVRWARTLWPSWPEPFFGEGVQRLSWNLDWGTAKWEEKCFLEPLAESTTELRSMAILLLALGLAAKEPGQSGLAVDALIAAVEEERLDSERLGAAMAMLFPSGLVKAARWAKTLAEAARASRLHATVVHRAVQRTLRGEPGSAPRDVVGLFELLRELSAELGEGITDAEALVYLGRVSAGGKTGTLARSLLRPAAAPEPPKARAKRKAPPKAS